jgi:hypothetical protein
MALRLSPDGARYVALGTGTPVPHPFAYRWLWPLLCRDSERAWVWSTRAALAAVVFFTGWLACIHTADGPWAEQWAAWAIAMAVVVGLPGVVDFNLRFPVLIDAPAMALALASAIMAEAGAWPAAMFLSLLAGWTKESAPLFAAAFSLNPVPLVGMVAPLVSRIFVKPGPELDEFRGREAGQAVLQPRRTSRLIERGRWRHFDRWLGPWGVALVGFAWWPALPAVALAYAQTIVATDRVRLYQWAGPIVAVGAGVLLAPAAVAQPGLVALVAILAWWRPWPSEGL